MTIYSTAQPIAMKHTENLQGYFCRWNPSLQIVDQATHTLRSAAILFLRDQGKRDSV